MMRKGILALVLLAFAFSLSPAALADTLSVTLAKPIQAGAPGTTLSYVATLTAASNNTGNLYLNGDAFNVSAPFTLNDSAFLNNFPFFLTPGQSVTNLLFTISSPLNSARGSFLGSFSILGGSTDSASTNIGTVNFSATVTPEPSSLILLGTGATGILGFVRRRQRVLVS